MGDKSAWVPELPPKAPRTGNKLTRAIGRAGLKAFGWRITGTLPDVEKMVICGAPHTSNWDFVVAMFASLALGVKFSYLMKKEAFFWPFKGLFMSMGGIPLDRSATTDTVDQIASWYRNHDKVWLAITPEGTRSKVEKWKTGFLRIAAKAEVPVFIVSWHYPDKALVLDKVWDTTGDHVKDCEDMRNYINSRFVGGRPEKQ